MNRIRLIIIIIVNSILIQFRTFLLFVSRPHSHSRIDFGRKSLVMGIGKCGISIIFFLVHSKFGCEDANFD